MDAEFFFRPEIVVGCVDNGMVTVLIGSEFNEVASSVPSRELIRSFNNMYYTVADFFQVSSFFSWLIAWWQSEREMKL